MKVDVAGQRVWVQICEMQSYKKGPALQRLMTRFSFRFEKETKNVEYYHYILITQYTEVVILSRKYILRAKLTYKST